MPIVKVKLATMTYLLKFAYIYLLNFLLN